MKSPLSQVKDENGTSLQSHAEVFLEKCNRAGISIMLLGMVPPDNLVLAGNVPVENVPDILNQLASTIRKRKPDGYNSLEYVNPSPTQIN